MSRLLDRLEQLFREGHARDIEQLRGDAEAMIDRLRPAAVLIAVTDRPDDHPDGPGAILIHRPATMRAHAGQVAFPGGAIDGGESAIAAALREAQEEIALDPAQVAILGATDPFFTSSGFAITPVLGVIPPDLPLVPNPDEVDSWFEAPLGFILDPANHTARTGRIEGREHRYLEMHWQGHRIWGVTAAIIANLARRVAWMGHRRGERASEARRGGEAPFE